MGDILIGALLANAVAWQFTPIQWIKRKLRLSQEDWEGMELPDIGQRIQIFGYAGQLHRLALKLLNCTACLGWWIGIAHLAFQLAHTTEITPWTVLKGLLIAVATLSAASIIERIGRG